MESEFKNTDEFLKKYFPDIKFTEQEKQEISNLLKMIDVLTNYQLELMGYKQKTGD